MCCRAFDTEIFVYTIVYMTYTAKDKMKETTRVSKWGNSLGIRLPARIAARAGILDDTLLAVEASADAVTLRPVRSDHKSFTLKQLLKHVRPMRDREAAEWVAMKPIGKEIW